MSRCCVLLILCSPAGFALNAGPPQPPLIKSLNSMIAKGTGGTYSGGKGVILRSPPVSAGLQARVDNTTKVVVGTFLVDDIEVPNIMYPSVGPGGPMCPNNGDTGFGKAVPCNPDKYGETGPWNYAQLGYVVGSNMSHVFSEFDKIQDPSWDWGVFYSTSANSDTQRCRYLPQYKAYDCPGYWLPWNANATKLPDKGGSQSFPPGNPMRDQSKGGGSGCHFATYSPMDGIDQTDAPDPNKQGANLVGDPHCSCNINLRSGGDRPWDTWVKQWLTYATPKQNFKWQGWFAGGRAPSFALDFAACWLNNPRDMILLQNAVWHRAAEWSNQKIPVSNWQIGAASQRSYWGWNEVPVAKEIDQPKYWDAVVIKLPLAICGQEGDDDTPDCMSKSGNKMLESSLEGYIKAGLLKTGQNASTHRPGSSVVFLREARHQQQYWTREFFCRAWKGPSGGLSVVQTTTACFLDKTAATSVMI